MRDKTRMYKDTMHEDVMEFGDLLASVCAPIQQELKIAEPVSAYNVGDMDKVAHIDEHEDERRKWMVNHRNFRKYCAGSSQAASSEDE